jgi:hypothetical protein
LVERALIDVPLLERESMPSAAVDVAKSPARNGSVLVDWAMTP